MKVLSLPLGFSQRLMGIQYDMGFSQNGPIDGIGFLLTLIFVNFIF